MSKPFTIQVSNGRVWPSEYRMPLADIRLSDGSIRRLYVDEVPSDHIIRDMWKWNLVIVRKARRRAKTRILWRKFDRRLWFGDRHFWVSWEFGLVLLMIAAAITLETIAAH